MVRRALGRINAVYGCLKPHEQREIMALILRKAEVNERQIVLGVYSLSGALAQDGQVVNPGRRVRQRPDWLPGSLSQSVLSDSFNRRLTGLDHLCRRETNARVALGTAETVARWRTWLETGVVKSRADLARREGLSRARITQALRRH